MIAMAIGCLKLPYWYQETRGRWKVPIIDKKACSCWKFDFRRKNLGCRENGWRKSGQRSLPEITKTNRPCDGWVHSAWTSGFWQKSYPGSRKWRNSTLARIHGALNKEQLLAVLSTRFGWLRPSYFCVENCSYGIRLAIAGFGVPRLLYVTESQLMYECSSQPASCHHNLKMLIRF